MTHTPPSQPLTFVKHGQRVSIANVPPSRTLLQVLRDDMGLPGTKEGCGEGDCGACTVVVAERDEVGLRYRAVNSCIKLAHSVQGMALWTVEDLQQADGRLHPAQQAMLELHGSQCGFCTPGFVMSLFGMYQNHVRQGCTITREQAQADLSGNLCRCTGYRPILEAAQSMGELPMPPQDEAAVRALLQTLESEAEPSPGHADQPFYLAPTTLTGLLQARAQHSKAQLVAGCTDVGLWVTKGFQQYEQVLDTTRVAELRRIQRHTHHLSIGAAATLTDAFAALAADRPPLQAFALRFAGLPVRNAGTLGGNVANGSPIGDSMPLLLALDAQVVLARWDPAQNQAVERRLPLRDFYTGYRKNVLQADEVLACIQVPAAATVYQPDAGTGTGKDGEWVRVYKVSKRFDDDISAVCLALALQIENGTVKQARLGLGGVAATPVRAPLTEAALTGQPWNAATASHAGAVLTDEFTPISDMRASAAYRRQVLGHLMQRAWLESSNTGHPVSLETLHPTLVPHAHAPRAAEPEERA
jgi:xanthine dehydrogenase small subunit